MWEKDGRDRSRPTRRAETIGTDPVWLSDTIGAIYDCALDPARWHGVIGAICDQFSFSSGLLGLAQIRDSVHEVRINYAMDAEWITAANTEYLSDTIALQGGAARIQAYPLGEPLVSTELLPSREREANRYFRDILVPRGMADAVLIGLAREPSLVGYLGLNRAAVTGPIRAEEIEGLRLIAPHLRRAVTIGNLFDLKAVETATFRSVLDSISSAVVLVDDDFRIIHANGKADAMLAAGDVILPSQGRLAVRGRFAEEALRAAVKIAAEDEARMSQRGIGIPVTAAPGTPAVLLHVLPLTRRDVRPGLAQRAVAAVFVVIAGAAPTPVDAIAAIYDFTPAESQIFASLCKGMSLDKTAKALGIAKSTARTHLLHVFAKTGCRRQAELVALGASLSLKL